MGKMGVRSHLIPGFSNIKGRWKRPFIVENPVLPLRNPRDSSTTEGPVGPFYDAGLQGNPVVSCIPGAPLGAPVLEIYKMNVHLT